tara:strand:- start:566 stop:898 length:333 start_codon:yes stop_codon:yes gene_type:complete
MAVLPLNSRLIISSTKTAPALQPIIEEPVENIYGDQPPRDNIDVSELASMIAGKLSVGDHSIQNKPIEVDIKRAISIGKLDKDAIRSDIQVGTVKTKAQQLRALRNKSGN